MLNFKMSSTFLSANDMRPYWLVGVIVIIIVILVWPPATAALLAIMAALPPFLNALAAFIATFKSKKSDSIAGE